MIIDESVINPLLREIDVMYIEGKLKVNEAEDLSDCINWIKNKSLNESNISYVIDSLRSYKKVMNKDIVCKIINQFRKICGSYL